MSDTQLPTALAEPDPHQELAPASTIAPERWGGGAGIAWLAEYERMAMAISRAVVLPKGIREAGDARTPEGRAAIAATVLAVALAGREFGLGFMAATRLVHVIDGKTSPAAELIVQRARERGHEIVPIERTARACRVTCASCDLPFVQQVEWALTEADRFHEDAVIAEYITQRGKPLTEKENYQNYGHDMMFWRAAVELIRRHCSEAAGGMYATEELS